jgi:4-amino-4-deoxy-L-arabinose transferase-like glycosyltransferase
VTRRSPWLDPTGVSAAIALAILAAIANGVWILLDHSQPSWDQSFYLATSLHYQEAFSGGGPGELLSTIKDTDPSHGPLFTILMLPFLYLFGPEQGSGLALNLLIAPVLYFSAGEIAWIVFRNWVARLLAIFLVATMPLMVGLFHNVLQDFLLVTLATLSLLLLLKSEGFQRRWMTWAMALTMGLGTLTKVTFPLFVIGPVLVVVIQVVASMLAARRDGEPGANRDRLRRLAVNLGGAALVYLAVAFVWYGPNFSETIDYVRSTTSGPLALGAGPTNPYTFDAVTSFTTGVVNSNLSWVILLTGLVALALSAERVRALFTRPLRWTPLANLAFLLAWAVIPYLSVALAHNQDVRLMAPALPAVAILVAGAVAGVRRRRARIALAGFAVIVLSYQTLTHVTDVTPGFLPDRVSVSVGSYDAVIGLNSEPIGYERLPEPDYGTPVIEYIEEVARVSPGGSELPRTVCMLQSEALINGNTFRYLAIAREDPYTFVDVVTTPDGTPRDLEEALSGCNFALFVKPPPVPPSGPDSRLTLVNEPFAAHHMTPRLLNLFQGPSRAFPLNGGRSEAEVEYLDNTGSNRVRVLVRTPGEGPLGG